ncbi:MAG TPA: hypothetical protein VF582_00045 [Allosphingosinicella sp.]
MKFSYAEAWQDAVRMLRSNASLFLGIAGAFFFLPALLVGYFAPQPEPQPTIAATIDAMQAYMDLNWHWVLLANLVNSLGAIAMYLLLFDAQGRTVGAAIAAALPILPLYFVLSLILSLSILLGLVLAIVPGVYLIGRLTISGAVMVAERRRNPIAALGGSWRLTKGKGWAVAGFLLVVFVVGWIFSLAVTSVLGSIFLLAAGNEGLGPLLVLILDSALEAAVSVVMIVLYAAIYRRLEAPASAPAAAG